MPVCAGMDMSHIDAAARLTTLTRIGFAARGLLYFVIGFLVIRTGQAEDPGGALAYVAQGGGRWLLALMAAGLIAYGIWRLADAVLDVERRGTDGKGLAERVAAGVSGLIHLGLAWQAFTLMSGSGTSGNRDMAGESAGAALQLPGGTVLLVLTGAVLIGVGLYQIVKAVTGGFLRHLEPQISGRAWVKLSGRAGYAARGLIFTIIGGFVMNAGLEERPDEAGGMADALAWLSSPWDLLIAVGLIGFGLFSMVEARYRIIRDVRGPMRRSR